METDGAARFTVYSRNYCHLCDDMIADLRDMQDGCGFALEIVDVDSDPALERRYGEAVPLLACGERELCRYVLDRAAVTAFLAEIR